MGSYNIHAGHSPAGTAAQGAVGFLNESTESRLIAGELIRLLANAGQTVYDCTVNADVGQREVLQRIVEKSNAHTVDFDLSIHLNSGRSDSAGDGSVGGFEIYVTNGEKGKGRLAENIRRNMEALGFRDRGTKIASNFYVLNRTKAPALLLEICFVDDRDDYNLYRQVGYRAIAQAIADAVLDQPSSAAEFLKEDGIWGPATTRRLQQIFGTVADGVVSHQFAVYKNGNPGLDGGWQWQERPDGSSMLIRAMQEKVNVRQDGHIGPVTIRGLQGWMGTVRDGYISRPSVVVRALQSWCNRQTGI